MSIETSKTFNTTSFTDEQFSHLLSEGFTVKEIERCDAQIQYRKEYNQRPEVKQKRALYNQQRYERMKQLRRLLK